MSCVSSDSPVRPLFRNPLGAQAYPRLTDSMLACIREFRHLEFLRVGSTSYGSSERSDGHLLQHVLPIIPHIRSPVFHTLEVYVSPWDPFFTTRGTHIDLLCGAELKAFLKRTPTLQTLGLSWPDTDDGLDEGLYDANWWTEQIIVRIPGLRGIVTVEIDSTPGPCEFFVRSMVPRRTCADTSSNSVVGPRASDSSGSTSRDDAE